MYNTDSTKKHVLCHGIERGVTGKEASFGGGESCKEYRRYHFMYIDSYLLDVNHPHRESFHTGFCACSTQCFYKCIIGLERGGTTKQDIYIYRQSGGSMKRRGWPIPPFAGWLWPTPVYFQAFPLATTILGYPKICNVFMTVALLKILGSKFTSSFFYFSI